MLRLQVANQFPQFSSLPSELRIKIWQAACFPRVVSLIYNSSSSTFHTTTPLPAILAVSHEAREEAFRIFSLCFGTSKHKAEIPFNPHYDTLYLPRYGEMGYDESLRDFRTITADPKRLLDQVKSIALDVVSLEVKRPWEGYNKATLLRSFRNLREIILVVGPTNNNEIESQDTKKYITEFKDPNEDPEKLLKVWFYFRQAFATEEKILAEVCQASGLDYVPYSLPTIKIRSKACILASPHTETYGSGVQDLTASMTRIGF